MRPRILFALVLALVLTLAFAAAAHGQAAYAEPTECYSCHGTGSSLGSAVDFTVAGVNYEVCRTCHLNLPDRGIAGPTHMHGRLTTCALACHDGVRGFYIDSQATVASLTLTSYGYFRSAVSPAASPAVLHAAHSGRGWVEATLSPGYPGCSRCHANVGCTVCHNSVVGHADHAASAYPAVPVMEADGLAVSTTTSTCSNGSCHSPANAGTSAFTPSCTSCHAGAEDATHAVGHTATDSVTEGIPCSACHALDVNIEHEKASSTTSGSSCAACHPVLAAAAYPWDGSCVTAGCHTAASSASMHANTASAHAVGSANLLCLDCHTGSDLGSIHTEAVSSTTGATSCLVCHTAAASPATGDCTVCHFTFETHYEPTRHAAVSVTCSGTGCHDTSLGLMGLHQQRNASFDCWGCHKSVRSDVQYAIDNNLTGCGDCHGDIYGSTSHRPAHWPVPVLQDATGPHYSYYTGSAGAAPTSDCVGCHTSNLVDEHLGLYLDGVVLVARKDSAGNDLDCDTCHDSVDTGVTAAIASGGKSCESCHQVHAPIPVLHTSSFVEAPELSCVDCHDADLSAEHGGGYTSSAGMTGCDVCHALYGGTSGAVDASAVQAAISVTNDTRCTACHAAYHTNVAAHEATTSGSLACGQCHGTAGSTLLDVNAIHPRCTTCHGAAAGRIDWSTATFECSSCHFTQGVDFHQGMTAHVTPTNGCSISGCHHSNTDVSVFHPSCTTCHTGTTDLGRTAACENCHGTVQGTDYHVGFRTAHTPTDAASQGCVGCHDTTTVTDLHVTNGCNTCHFQTGCSDCHQTHMGGVGLTKSTACAACHSVEGTDYHSNMTTGHTYSAMPSSCTSGTTCHVATTLPEEHGRFIAEYGYASTCDLCHENTDPVRIEWATASADCSSCHDVHGDIATLHTAAASNGCIDCHESADLRVLHGETQDASCAVCHSAPVGRIDWTTATGECVSCHGDISPADPKHYDPAMHEASAETGCSQCHYRDMKTEHLKSTVAVSCVTCHEVKVDSLTAAWDKTCTACHATKHGDTATRHVSTNTACGGTGCHDIADASSIHGAAGGPGCAACHPGPATPATTTDCTACHPNVGTNHHEAHNAASANPSGCQGCHKMYLDDEHAALGFTCDTCHKSTTSAVVNAIVAGDVRCKSCHPAMHGAQDWEFNPVRASVHRVNSALPGMRSSFTIGSSTYSWSLPSASSFLKTGWTTDSMMACADCHSYSGAAGPHGATMQVNIDPAYPNPYRVTTGSSTSTAQLSRNSPTGMSMRDGGSTAAGIICEKCHDLNGTGSNFSNVVHSEHDDRGREGGYCNYCHTGLPHGWSRPRMIAYTTDPAPYNTYAGGVQRISLKSYSPNGWSKSDCGAACSSDRHPLSGTSWPASDAVVPTTGGIGGTVKTSAGMAIVGATVTVGAKSATTTSSGYSISAVTAGSYTMTVTATGYTAWSGTVTVTAGSTATQNVTLSAAPVTTGTVSGTVTNASSSAAVSGATVSVGGKSATTGSSGAYTITGVTAGAYTMTVTATGYTQASTSVTVVGGQTVSKNVALTPIVPTSANLARTGTATASSTSSTSYYPASKTIDGSTSTYWRSSGHDTEWLRVDLGAAKTISKVVVNWYGTSYARSYRIETSSDGYNWTQRYATSSGNGGIDAITLASPIAARYVRVYCTSANASDYRILEFEVWGY